MHQFEPEGFRTALAAMQAGDAVLAAANAGAADFWDTSFAGLSA